MKLNIAIPIIIAFALFASFAYADSAVNIEPNPAHDSDTLHCVVNAGGSGYAYTWYKNNAETGINGAYVSPNQTNAWDAWKCVVKKFYSGGLGWITIGQDSVTIQTDITPPPTNQPPVVRIVSPDAGTYVQGTLLTFSGTAVDPEDGNITNHNKFVWRSDIDGIIASDNDFTYSSLSVGTHSITLTVNDSKGLAGSDSRTITITPKNQTNGTNQAPTVDLIYPLNSSNFNQGDVVHFLASATDPEEGILQGNSVRWYIDNNYITSGVEFYYSGLSNGTHAIIVYAFDSQGLNDSDTATITVGNATAANNSVPNVSITSPANGTTFLNGTSITFEGYAVDAEDGTNLALRWFDNEILIGTSRLFSLSNLSVGTHTITFNATDSQGATGTASILIHINVSNLTNNNPSINILTPPNNSIFLNGSYLMLSAQAVDPEDGVLTGNSIRWYNNGTNFANGTNYLTNDLTVGVHQITATATDSNGASASASIVVTINLPNSTNLPPNATIIRPLNNSVFNNGSTILFEGSATDPEDGFVNNVTWYSDINGLLGNNIIFTLSNLSVGNHTIIFVATDSQGATGSDVRRIEVIRRNAVNLPPQIEILTPLNNATFTNGTSIFFSAEATDPEDGVLAGNSVRWYDNGINFANGTAVLVSNLSAGIHNITATATDSNNQTAFDSAVISVVFQNVTNNPPVVNITAPNDNAVFANGTNIVFVGEGHDPEDGILTGPSLLWTDIFNGSQNLLGEGNTVQASSLETGNHTIVLYGIDSQGLAANDSIRISIVLQNQTNQTNRTAPNVNIIFPYDGSNFSINSTIDFFGSAVDSDGNNITSVQWVSDIDGIVGNVLNFTRQLSEGMHNITLVATDGNGLQGTDYVMITIGNASGNQTNGTPSGINPPVVLLFSPGDRSVQYSNSIGFMFNASDNGSITSCSLIIDGASVKNSAAAQGMNTISYSMPSGDHNWQVACFDNENNIGYSETRYITIATGNFTFYQPPVKVKVEQPYYEILIKSISYDENAEPGETVPVKVTVENTGDFDINDISLSVSVYDLDAYGRATFDLGKGRDASKTIYLDIPDYAESGVYDLKIDINSENVHRMAYRELSII